MGIFDKSKKRSKAIGVNKLLFDAFNIDPEEAKICEEASDLISEALRSVESGRTEEAEKFYLNGIEKYRKTRKGLDYALGMYGNFLMDQERFEDAEKVLKEAIDKNTEIQNIWWNYVGVLSELQEVKSLFKYVDLMIARFPEQYSSPYSTRTEWILNLTCRGVKPEKFGFAKTVARKAMDEATASDDNVGRWSSAGELGHILERMGRMDEAVKIWAETFQEGSDYPLTANRLSLYFERAKEWEKACGIIEEALKRGFKANVEEQIRKRYVRCKVKLDPSAKKHDVQAFSVRYGIDAFKLIYQKRIKPPIRDIKIIDSVVCCIGDTKESSIFINIDLNSGDEIARIDAKVNLGDVFFNDSGWGLGLNRISEEEQDSTYVNFLNQKREVINSMELREFAYDVLSKNNRWYFNCKDGYLYSFDVNGKMQWKWETPGSQEYQEEDEYDDQPLYRPHAGMPIFFGESIIVKNGPDIFSINLDGKDVWHIQLPGKNIMKEDIGFADSLPFVNFLIVNENKLLAGSSYGDIYRIDQNGNIVDVHDIGKSVIIPYPRQDGSIAVAWCDDKIIFLKGFKIVKTLDYPRPPYGMDYLDGDYVFLENKNLQVIDSKGNKLWSVDFSKHLKKAVIHDGRIVCLAGVLAVFER